MIKKLAVLLLLTGCAGNTCLKQTTAANMTLGEIVYQSNMAYDAQYIDIDTLEKVDAATDQAKNALDTARLMCVAEDKSFDLQMKRVQAGVTQSLAIMDEGKKK